MFTAAVRSYVQCRALAALCPCPQSTAAPLLCRTETFRTGQRQSQSSDMGTTSQAEIWAFKSKCQTLLMRRRPPSSSATITAPLTARFSQVPLHKTTEKVPQEQSRSLLTTFGGPQPRPLLLHHLSSKSPSRGTGEIRLCSSSSAGVQHQEDFPRAQHLRQDLKEQFLR